MITTPPPAKRALVNALIALAIAIAAIIYLFWYTGHRNGPETDTGTSSSRLTAKEKAVFFSQSVSPILDANASANAKALETLKADIHALFEQYRRRVPDFTADITGIGNKSKVTWEAMKQLTSDDKDKVKRHVTGKFEMHVVSAKKMQSDLETLLQGFRRDIEANRNRMLVDIEATVKADPRLSVVGIKLPDAFAKEIEAKIGKASVQAGKDGVELSMWTFIASAASEEFVRNLVIAALTRVGTSLAASMGTTAVASGGATVAGGAGGGATGTLGGPAGVVIGFAVGVTVGVIVDYVMTERMETKLNQECTQFLTKVEVSLTTEPDGLTPALEKALSEMANVQGPVIKQQIETLP